jgi:glycosyltransferase involved in cell wall biosynthesis
MGKKAFVFLYNNMNLGGVQRYIYDYIKFFNQDGIDTYWIAPRKAIIDIGFIEEFQKVHVLHNVTHKKMEKTLELYDDVVALAFSVLQFEKLKKFVGYSNKIRLLYIIPHFKNPELYPEEFFYIAVFKKRIKTWLTHFYSDYFAANELFYINPIHGGTLFEHYGLTNNDIEGHVCKKNRQIPKIDLSAIQRKIQKKDVFNIITVSRFEFPHKGYILGLIDSFAEIKRRIPIAQLCIIGYGDGEIEVKKRISALPADISNSIIFLGRVSYNELKRYYDDSKISIAVAGSVTDGAILAVPTLVARHYYERCEVYGQYVNCSDKILSDSPGEDVVPYIEDVYRMGDVEYLELCKATYERAKSILQKDFDPFWMFKIVQNKPIPHSVFQIEILNVRAWLWTWGKRFEMLFCNPKVFFGKMIKSLRI